ncbi:adenylate/guanylate cyclase domain-containing protein [Xenophilus arseniciresistens]|uniref:Adenylate/guanylate cyclase domain-containing protein n=1 Tax=Xenophilus arseniciresistens TaxID=1283306 RepID=A0AAE3N9P5_9BURK|nr:adenylate/guanylate cyclase domain-containing protein [Xenophilus arseniciresistens]MDA7416876.1 adenylate/guanylate cyclase domain-containing protein [Xenophilus arseniciresistens]
MKWRPRQGPRIVLSLLPLVLVLAHLGGWMQLPVIQALDAFIYDARLRLTASQQADPRVVIVDIDDASLLQYGQWPWTRDRLAALTRELTVRQQAGVLGFDIMFVERERSAAQAVLQALREGPLAGNSAVMAQLEQLAATTDSERLFAQALRDQPAVLGFYFTQSDGAAAAGGSAGVLPPAVLPTGLLPAAADHVPRWSHYGTSLPQLAKVAPAGFLNVVLDPQADGMVREVPLLGRYAPPNAEEADKGGYYEALSLAVYRRWLGAQLAVSVDAGGAGDPPRLQSLLLQSAAGQRVVPVDAMGRILVPYRHSGGPQGGIYRYVSAADVLEGRLAPGELQGKAVLIGTSAAGLNDLSVTPVNATLPGVEVHASVLSALMDGRFLHVPLHADAFVALAVVVLVGGLAIGLAVFRISTMLLVVVLGTAAVVAVTQWLYLREGMVIPLAAMLLAVALALASNMAWDYFVEARTRRSLVRLFGSYVPPQLVGQMLQDPERYSMRAESKQLTVMFCDMRGFTRLSEGMAPQQLQPLLNDIFSRLATVIAAHRGTVDKYMGDCVMAFWGAPVDTPEHATLAVDAACQLVAEVASINRDHQGQGLPPVQLGIGLNTGLMMVGDMGSTLRRSYTVIGDAVNLASRLEGLGERYGVDIVVGPETAGSASAYLWQELDRVRVKGKQQAVLIHAPRGLASQADEALLAELSQWQQVRHAYLTRQWLLAQQLLQSLRKRDEKNVLYQLYAERVALLLAQPAEPGWDGTEHIQAK